MTDNREDPEDRSAVDDKDWDAAGPGEKGESVLDDFEEKTGGGGGQEQGEPFRVTESNFAGRVPVWYGVRSCCDAGRAVQEMTPHFEAWVQKTIAAHPNNVAVAKGYGNGRIWCENKTVNGKRKCKGGFTTLTVYVDFQ